MKKSILITGCSSGIGYDAAVELQRKNWRVFATCRQQTDCSKLINDGFESFSLDLSNESSIIEAVKKLNKKTGGVLDAVFNNGAFMLPGAVEDLKRDAIREIFEVNVFGQVDLINRCFPLLEKSISPRIVNCSSVLGFASLPYRGAYNATKFALEAFTDAMRRENLTNKIKFILIEPGPISTKIRENAIPKFEKWIDWQHSRQKAFYEKILIKRLYSSTTKKDFFELPPSQVTKKLIHALESSNPRARYFVTTPTYIASIITRLLPTKLQDFLLKY